MSQSMSAIGTTLAQRYLDIVLKPRGHGGADAPAGQKFADVAQAQFCIPFVTPPALRAAVPLKQKRHSAKDRRADDDRTGDGSRESLTGERRPTRNSHAVDVRV